MPLREPQPIVGPDGKMITVVIPQTTLPKPVVQQPDASQGVRPELQYLLDDLPPVAPIDQPVQGVRPELQYLLEDIPTTVPAPILDSSLQQVRPELRHLLEDPTAPIDSTTPIAPIQPVEPPEKKIWSDALLGSNWLSVLPFVGSIDEGIDAVNIFILAGKVERGEATPEEKQEMNEFLIESQRPATFGYSLVQGLLQLPAFVIELGLTAGVYTAGKAVGAKALKKGLLKYATSKAGKIAIAAGSRVVGVAAQTAVARAPSVFAGTVERITPTVQLDPSEAEELNFTIQHDEAGVVEAFAKSFAENMVEVGTERAGAMLDRMPVGQIFQASLKRFLRINPGKRMADFIAMTQNRLLRNSFIAETIEEEIAKPIHILFGTSTRLRGEENVWKNRFREQYSLKNYLLQTAILAVPSAAGVALQKLTTPAEDVFVQDCREQMKAIGIPKERMGDFPDRFAKTQTSEEFEAVLTDFSNTFSDIVPKPDISPVAAPEAAEAPLVEKAPIKVPELSVTPKVKPKVTPVEQKRMSKANVADFKIFYGEMTTIAELRAEERKWDESPDDNRQQHAFELIENRKKQIQEQPISPPAVPKAVDIPKGWKVSIQPGWLKRVGWGATVDWRGKRIVFETPKDAKDIDKINHEVAHIRIEDAIGYIDKLSDSPLLEKYVEITKQPKDIHRNFIREDMAIDYGEYLTNPEKTKPELRDLFNTISPLPAPTITKETEPSAQLPKEAPAGVISRKVGDTVKILEIDSVVTEVFSDEGVDYELYKEVDGDRGVIRVVDVESGEVVTIKKYPTLAQAETEFRTTVKPFGKAVPEAKSTEITEPTKQLLPRDLRGAQPRYGYGKKLFELTFESDIDKALYITAQTKKSKRDASYREFLKDNGLTDKEIDSKGQRVRNNIKTMAATSPAGILSISKSEVTEKTKPVKKTKAPKLTKAKQAEAKKPTKAEPTDVVSTLADKKKYPAVYVPINKITLSKDVPQFKERADIKTGVVEGQQLKGKYTHLGTGNVVLWERTDGRLELITGRHRFDLAKRTKEETILAQTVKESEGFTAEMAMILDAELNILDEKGDVSDYAKYFKHTRISETEARKRGLLSRTKGNSGWSMGKDASDDLYTLWRKPAGGISTEKAVAIAQTAPGNADLQGIGIRAFLAGASTDEIVGQMEVAQSVVSKVAPAKQTDMFADTRYAETWKKQAVYIAKKRRGLQGIISTRSSVVNKYDVATATGSIKAELSQATAELEAAKAALDRWKSWSIDPELSKEVETLGKSLETGFRNDEISMSRAEPGAKAPRGRVKAKQAQYIVDEMMKGYENKPMGGAVVVQSESELDRLGLSQESRQAIRNANAEGFYHIPSETVVIIADNLQRPSDVIRVMLHETIGHFGIRQVLGAEFESEMARIGKLIPAADLQKAIDDYGEKLAVEEYLAKRAAVRSPTLYQQFIKAIKAALKRIGVNPKIIDKWDKRGEIDRLIDAARDFVERGPVMERAAPEVRPSEVRLAAEREFKLEKVSMGQLRSEDTMRKQNEEAKRQKKAWEDKMAGKLKGETAMQMELLPGEGDLFTQRRDIKPSVLAQEAEYMKAAEAGDTETAQKIVDERAKVAGYTIGPVWHGGEKGFTVFDWNRIGKQGTTEGKGFYFSNDKKLAQGYADRHGGRLLKVYLRGGENINGERLTISKSQVSKMLHELHNKSEAVEEGFSPLWNYGDISYEGLQKVVNEAADNLVESSEDDVSLIAGLINGGADPGLTYEAFRNIRGETGIIEHDAWGRKGHEVHVATSARHVKSADPITYDDQGNIIPLSQRFQPTEADIRLSESGEKRPEMVEHKFGKRVSKDIRLTPELRKAMENRLHEVRHDKDVIETVMDRIGKGLDIAEVDFYRPTSDLKPDERVATGQVLMQAHNDAARTATAAKDEATIKIHLDRAIDIGHKLDEYGLEYGRGIHAFKHWNETLSTLEGAQRMFEKNNAKFVGMKMTNADIQEAVRTANEENAKAFDKTMLEPYAEKRIAEVLHRMGIRNRVGLSDRMKKKVFKQGIKEFRARPENKEAEAADVLFAAPEVSLDEKIDAATRYGVGVLDDAGDIAFTPFAETMKKKYGPKIEPYLQRIYDGATIMLNRAGLEGVPKKGKKTRAVRSVNAEVKAILKQWFAGDPNASREPVLELLKAVGMTERESVKLVMGIQQKFIEKAQKAKMRRLKKLLTPGRLISLGNRKAIKRLLEISNLTPLSDPVVRNTISQIYNLPELTDKVGEKLDQMAKTIKKAPAGFQKQDATINMLDYMKKQMPTDWFDVGWSMWYANILSGLLTPMRNMLFNEANALNTLGASMIVEPRNAGFAMWGYVRGVSEGVSAARKVFKTGRFPAYGEKFGPSGALERSPFTGMARILNTWKYVWRSLAAQDMLVFRRSYTSRMMMMMADIARQEPGITKANLALKVTELMGWTEHQQAAFRQQAIDEGLKSKLDIKQRIVELSEEGLPNEVKTEAMDYAQRITMNYQPEGQIGVIAKKIGEASIDVPVIHGVIPFTRILANLSNVTLDNSPWAGVRLLNGIKDATGINQPIMGHTREILKIKGIMSTAAMVTIYLLSKMNDAPDDEDDKEKRSKWFDIYGPGPTDYNKRNQLKETGWKPNSFRIGKHYIPFSLHPAAVAFSIVANVRDAERWGKLDEKSIQTRLAFAAVRSSAVVFDMSFMSGVNQIVTGLQRDTPDAAAKWVKSMVARYAGTLIPSGVKHVANIFDPSIRDNATYEQALLREIPFVSYGVRPKINLLGEEVRRKAGPINLVYGYKRDDPVWNLIVDKEVFISKPSTATEIGYRDRRRVMTEEEYYNYVKESGKIIREQIEKLLPRLQKMNKEQVGKVVKKITLGARKMIKNKIWRNMEKTK